MEDPSNESLRVSSAFDDIFVETGNKKRTYYSARPKTLDRKVTFAETEKYIRAHLGNGAISGPVFASACMMPIS